MNSALIHELIEEIETLNRGGVFTELETSINRQYNCPLEWYEVDYLKSSYSICCHNHTRFYNWSRENRFLDGYMELPIKEPVSSEL
jgi:hypothetical protein